MVCRSAKIFLMLSHCLLESHRIMVNQTFALKMIILALGLFYIENQEFQKVLTIWKTVMGPYIAAAYCHLESEMAKKLLKGPFH